MKNKKVLIIVIALVLVIAIGGVTFAWFNYYKEGESKKLVAGDIYMTYNEGPETINLVNIFPETKEEARDTSLHNVNDETNTASPGLTSQAIKAKVKASVPEPQVEQYLVPAYSANLVSSSLVSGPWQ
jgi:flagellar basal body-associated protein FliL